MAAADVEDMASARQHGGRDGEDEVVVCVADGGADGFVAEDDAAAPGRERVSQRLAVRGVPFVREHDDGRRTREPARRGGGDCSWCRVARALAPESHGLREPVVRLVAAADVDRVERGRRETQGIDHPVRGFLRRDRRSGARADAALVPRQTVLERVVPVWKSNMAPHAIDAPLSL